MNLLTIGLIAGGIYLATQANKKQTITISSKGWTNPNLPENVPTKLPKDIFYASWLDGDRVYAYAIDLNDKNKLVKTNKFNKIQEDRIDEVITKGYSINSKYFELLGIKDTKEYKAFEYLYGKDYKFMNSIYRDYLINIINTINDSNNKNAMIQMLPNLFKEYFTFLEKSGVPEDKWPNDDLGV